MTVLHACDAKMQHDLKLETCNKNTKISTDHSSRTFTPRNQVALLRIMEVNLAITSNCREQEMLGKMRYILMRRIEG